MCPKPSPLPRERQLEPTPFARGRRRWWKAALLAVGVALGSGVGAGGAAPATPVAAATTNGPFELTRVHALRIELSASEWQAMQTSAGSGPGWGNWFGGGARSAKVDVATPKDRDTHRSGGKEFPWAHATVHADGRVFTNAGVRYKGNFTFMISAGTLRRSLKIELPRFDKGAADWGGETTFNLHAGVTDSSRLREAFSYLVFREAGVAAPRTAFAEVSLTVPGRYEREYAGLYTLTEQVDKRFLKRHFGSGDGLLMKPQLRGPDYLGEDWAAYPNRYCPQREARREESQRTIEFARFVNRAGDAEFRQRIGQYLDVDEFLRFLGASALVAHLDSPLAMPQNYYIYLNPGTQLFVFLPWDLDLGMGAWPFGGTPEQQMDLSLLHPHAGKHRLIDRLLAVPELKTRYLAILKGFAEGCFAREKLLAQVDALQAAVREPLEREREAVAARHERAVDFDSMFGRRAPTDPRAFVVKRTESVRAQLAGERTGYVPVGMGMP